MVEGMVRLHHGGKAEVWIQGDGSGSFQTAPLDDWCKSTRFTGCSLKEIRKEREKARRDLSRQRAQRYSADFVYDLKDLTSLRFQAHGRMKFHVVYEGMTVKFNDGRIVEAVGRHATFFLDENEELVLPTDGSCRLVRDRKLLKK